MNFLSIKSVLLLLLIAAFAPNVNCQQQVKQLIVASGGAFSNPIDHVSLSSYNPIDQTKVNFGEINTQAVQHALIDGSRLYITALDSLVMFDLNSY